MSNIVVFLVLITVGYIWGSSREKKHFESLARREKKLLSLPVRSEDHADYENVSVVLVAASVVVASDYFKTIATALRGLIGGHIRSQELLMDRARREAMIRLKEQAYDLNAAEVIGLRMEMNSLDQLGVEVMVYGTAVISS